MYGLIFETEQEAKDRSFQEASKKLGDKHTTEYWWGWVELPDGKFALLVEEGTEGSVIL